jgi:hypothetical protein
MAYYKPNFEKTSFHYVYDSAVRNLSVAGNIATNVYPREYLQVRTEFNNGGPVKWFFNTIPGPI